MNLSFDGLHSVCVSVVIPSYNAEKYIEETINSVLAQTFQDLEVVVVDDGSSDRTCEIVQSYPERVRLIKQTNGGVCRARNRGLSEARGEFVCFLDHDDCWHPEKLALQLPQFGSDKTVGMVYSGFEWWRPNDNGTFVPSAHLLAQPLEAGVDERFSGWVYHEFLLDCWALTSTAVIRASALREIGGFDETLPYSEDWDLWIRLSRQYKFIKLKARLVLYRQHAKQGSRMVRDIDFRTRLLEQAQRRWGLTSADGRSISTLDFRTKLGHYHAEFGLHHLGAGNLRRAYVSLWRAWRMMPSRPKYLVYIIASMCGWRPRL